MAEAYGKGRGLVKVGDVFKVQILRHVWRISSGLWDAELAAFDRYR